MGADDIRSLCMGKGGQAGARDMGLMAMLRSPSRLVMPIILIEKLCESGDWIDQLVCLKMLRNLQRVQQPLCLVPVAAFAG